MPMILVKYRATPLTSLPDHGRIGGAYINGWVLAASIEEGDVYYSEKRYVRMIGW